MQDELGVMWFLFTYTGKLR